jgi:TatD DNase family protein
MKLFDTHFHYYGEPEPAEYWSSIVIPELGYLLAVGASFEESVKAQCFAEQVDCSWFAAGVHPHSAAEYARDTCNFAQFKGHPRLIAIGELGLDYYYEHSERQIQRQVFEHFLQIALKWNLPAIVHCRDRESCFDAYDECFTILNNFASSGGRFVVHCFSGTPYWAEKFLSLGGYLGITGMITFPKAENIRETLRVIPDERMLIETDSPYLAPLPYRGKTNNPGYLIKVAEKIAEQRHKKIEEIAELTTKNAFRFFSIKETSII